MIRNGLRALLATRPDLEVIADAATGHEALDAARRAPPDIAIIDHMLPGLNGCGLCLQLRKVAPSIHVIIYTMLDDAQTVCDALKAGASGFVLKSDTEGDLFAAIDSVAQGNFFFSRGIPDDRYWPRPPRASPGIAPGLTPRQQEIVQLVAEGLHNKQVARLLGLTVKTVESHRAAAMRKLELRSTADLVRYALRHNIALN